MRHGQSFVGSMRPQPHLLGIILGILYLEQEYQVTQGSDTHITSTMMHLLGFLYDTLNVDIKHIYCQRLELICNFN
jgi:hypothetical protein